MQCGMVSPRESLCALTERTIYRSSRMQEFIRALQARHMSVMASQNMGKFIVWWSEQLFGEANNKVNINDLLY